MNRARSRRDSLSFAALAEMPKLLTLMDRNPHSPTYGCFDRNYWHYRIIDFPSGMAQEFVWPLALAYATDCPGNPYYRQPVLTQWVLAGIRYASRASHADGSCDDYFPFEKAAGAAAFSLLACAESYDLLGFEDQPVLNFMGRRADWLAGHDESGRLSNHQALITLCLYRMGELLNTDRWREAARGRLERLLDWQSPDGWFAEYEGCDPGYQSLTISILARIHERWPSEELRASLVSAITLAGQFLHPDGSYGGEYGSRSTYNFFPHGFELAGRWLPEALEVNDGFLAGLERGLGPCFSDDHVIGHHVWNYLLAWRDFVEHRQGPKPREEGRFWSETAGLLVDRRENTELYVGLNKGGVFKYFRQGELVVSDTQVSLQVRRGGKLRTAVAHLVGDYEIRVAADRISVAGAMGWAKQVAMTSPRLLLLRCVMLSFGRFFPNLVRRLLQAMLITDKRDAPFRFERTFTWKDGGWEVDDRVTGDALDSIEAAGIGCDQTSIYVATSRTFQRGQLRPALDLTGSLGRLVENNSLRLSRRL